MTKTWFVTGASRGIGAEIVRTALAAGDNVVATARDAGKIEQAFGNAQDKRLAQGKLLALSLDVTDEAAPPRAVAAALARFGHIDVLVNNAGYGHLGLFEECTAEEVHRQYATNVFGLMAVTRAVLPTMRKQRSGRIINISSIAGYKGMLGGSLYNSSKFAVEGFSQSIAEELAPFGIHVTAVSPGYVRTDFLDSTSIKYSAPQIDDYAQVSNKLREFFEGRNHAQIGDPARLAAVILELANMSDPPVSFVAGSDAVEMETQVLAKHQNELDRFRSLSLSTDGRW